MEEDDVEDDDVKGEEEDDEKNDEVEEEEDDDTEDADAEEDDPKTTLLVLCEPVQSKCTSTGLRAKNSFISTCMKHWSSRASSRMSWQCSGVRLLLFPDRCITEATGATITMYGTSGKV